MDEELYRVLQAVFACPLGCKCCVNHERAVKVVLAEYLKAWQAKQDVMVETTD